MTTTAESLATLDQQLKEKYQEHSDNMQRMKVAIKTSAKANTTANFPLDVFPMRLQEMVRAYCTTFGADPGHYGLAILTVAGAVIGNAAWVEERGNAHPPLIYGAMVDSPGRGKTPIGRTILRPVIEIEREMREAHAAELREWKKKCQEAAQNKDNETPAPPTGKELVLYDFTLESAYRVLQASPRGVIVFRDEIAGWVNSMNQYKQKGSEEQFWLENYNSGMVKINRQNRDRPMMVYNSFVAVLGGTQPKILEKFVEGDKAYNGFLARMLWSYPDTTSKPLYSTSRVDVSWKEFWSKIIKRLYALPCRQTAPTDEYDDWRLDPIMIPLEEGAQREYREYYDTLAKEVNSSDDEVEQSVLTKYDSHVLRLAGILHFLHWAESDKRDWIDEIGGITENDLERMKISESAMTGAIRLAKYFRYTSMKVVGRVSSPIDTLPEVQKIWYQNLPEEFERQTAVDLATVANISARTVSRLLTNTVLFKRVRQGVYWKNQLG
jgi:hypothetical protein